MSVSMRLNASHRKCTPFSGTSRPHEQHVLARLESERGELARRPRLRQQRAIRDVGRVDVVDLLEVLTQRLAHDDGPVGEVRGRPLALLEHPCGGLAPLLALPVEAVHRDHGLGPGQSRQPREQRGPEGMEMHDIVMTHHRLERRPCDVRGGVEMLGVDRGSPQQTDAVVLGPRRRVIQPTEHVHVDAAVHESTRDLIDVTLDAAVRGGDALLPDHGDAHHAAPSRRAARRAAKRSARRAPSAPHA
jgi:hypothetical protein